MFKILNYQSEFAFLRPLLEANAQVYLVGGSVRDIILKKPHKDFDFLVSQASFETITSCLKPFGTINKVGKSFGVIKFRPKNYPDLEIDLSLPRKEVSTGVGHKDFQVIFDPNLPIELDLGRRDFTINAMALNIQTQEMIDPFGGQNDLKRNLLKQVFHEAFAEDPLRLLRAIQFAARFELEIEPETLQNMTDHAHLIQTVSKERIIEEIRKVFLANKPSKAFLCMRRVGMLKYIFPFMHKMIGVKQPNKKNEDVFDHTMKVLDASRLSEELEKPGDLNIMFAALFHDSGKPQTAGFDSDKDRVSFYGHQNVSRKIARRWLDEYKATHIGADVPKILNLIHNHMFETKAFFSDKAIRRFINKIGDDSIFDAIDLRIADKKGGRFPQAMKGIINLRKRIREELDKKPPLTSKDLALNGHHIMNMGFQAGPIIGTIQRFLVDKVLDEPELNNIETLEKLVLENFGEHLSKAINEQ